MDCLFCKIAKKEIPSKIVYDDDDTMAFLDINPANPGHILVVPKKHSEMIMDADNESLQKTILVVKELSRKAMHELKAEGVNVVQNNGKAAGQLVHHVHFHIIPRFSEDMVIISYKRAQLDEAKMEELRKKLDTKPLHFEAPKPHHEEKKEHHVPQHKVSPDKWVDM